MERKKKKAGETLKIESHIEPPRNALTMQVYRRTVDAMNIGDSVFVEENKDASRLASMLREAGWKGATRFLGNGYRVWKIGKRDQPEFVDED